MAEAEASDDDLLDELLKLLWELTGGTDIERCFTEGDIGSCIMAAIGMIPWGKLLKVGSKIPKMWRLFDRWRDARRLRNTRRADVDNANQRYNTAQNACRVGNSFPPGTPVLMGDGSYAPIEEIDLGDEVWAFDPLTGVEGPREVTTLYATDGEKTLVEVTVTADDGTADTLVTTGNHPFWVPASVEWTDAIDLGPGAELRTSSGAWVEVSEIDAWSATDQQVHNLTVDGLHTYYVLAGSTPILVHNQNTGCGVTSAISEDPYLVRQAEKAGRNQKVQDEINHLVTQYVGGNKNPGIGNKSLPGTGLQYLRGKDGARVFFRTNSNGDMEIVAKASKANESEVIRHLQSVYGN